MRDSKDAFAGSCRAAQIRCQALPRAQEAEPGWTAQRGCLGSAAPVSHRSCVQLLQQLLSRQEMQSPDPAPECRCCQRRGKQECRVGGWGLGPASNSTRRRQRQHRDGSCSAARYQRFLCAPCTHLASQMRVAKPSSTSR